MRTVPDRNSNGSGSRWIHHMIVVPPRMRAMAAVAQRHKVALPAGTRKIGKVPLSTRIVTIMLVAASGEARIAPVSAPHLGLLNPYTVRTTTANTAGVIHNIRLGA